MNAATSIGVSGVRKSFATTEVLRDVDISVDPGSVVSLLGPSGCGKTTLLRCIAGLERIDKGEIRLGDRLVSGPATHMPPERRRIGMVFQDWALFPHLTVAQNVVYGLPRSERTAARVAEALDMVGLGGLGGRKPSTLSGGQQQRVALARALAPRPRVLLLDEPFSNLDTVLRVQVRTEVHQLLAELEVTTVFVTHDQEEAFVLGDEVAVTNQGQVVQQASPAELYARPATPWVADFVGDANLLAGQAAGVQAQTPVGPVPLEVPAEGVVEVMLRPEELRLDPLAAPNGPNGPNGSSAGATVELQEYYGHDTVYVIRLDREVHGSDAGAGTGTGESLPSPPQLSAASPEQGTLRVRAWSVPRFDRGDRVSVSYVGPPALAFPADSASAAGPAGSSTELIDVSGLSR